ncbi:hypothetical protein [Acinetobacter sp. YH16032]|uniref:hypothetical protein n=1 Tax=Acinetobacter sp. YH16032 TaxID=2601181 RepID=UPI0015D26163|nr:hypothetical protein [Acinetobacter sp. YH16032]
MHDNYWNRFLHIEKKLKEFSTHVDFDIRNNETFSIEIMNLYLTICSEIEAIFKACTSNISNSFNFRDFREYYKEETQLQSLSLLKSDVKIKYTSLKFTPFDKIDSDETILWWNHHNKIKHDREINRNLANLKNLLNSASALFLLNLVYRFVVQEKIYLIPPPEIFETKDFLVSIHSSGGGLLYTSKACINSFGAESPFDHD